LLAAYLLNFSHHLLLLFTAGLPLGATIEGGSGAKIPERSPMCIYRLKMKPRAKHAEVCSNAGV
jgi:hypothetical protein